MILKETLEITRSTKFLGVIIDNKLKWTDHITYIKKKISKAIGIIHRARTFLDKITLKNLYHSFVFPYLIYCTEIWGKLSNYSLKSYNYIAKKNVFELLLFLITYPHQKPLFDSLDILKFESLVIQRISLLMYKYSTGSVPSPIFDLFKKSNEVHTHFTRKSISLSTPRGKSEGEV